MTDILVVNDHCCGMIAKTRDGETLHIHAQDTVMATGGIGGLYEHSTNFPILTGDACRIAEQHGVELEHMDYVQIHPSCLYSKKPGRSFLISESARGEGAILLNHKGERFVNELLPRDVVTKAIREEMEKEGVDHEFISFENVPEEIIKGHFPHIYEKCLEEGYDILKEPGTDRSGTALFYGRRPCGPRFGNDYAASVCGRGDKLQRGSREEPACQQQSPGEPCFCKARRTKDRTYTERKRRT